MMPPPKTMSIEPDLEPTPSAPMESYRRTHGRLWILFGFMLMIFMVLGVGLFYRQVILNSKYRALEERQSLRRIVQPGPRGCIYDRNGELLVGNEPRFSVVLYLGELRDAFRTEYWKLLKAAKASGEIVVGSQLRKAARRKVVQGYLNTVNAILGRSEPLNAEQLERHFHQRLLLPMPLIEDINQNEFARLIERLPVQSPVQLYTDTKRYYPHGSAAAHVLGYVSSSQSVSPEGMPGDALATFNFQGNIGKVGLEKSFEDALQGVSGGEVWRVDPAGFQYALEYQRTPMQGNHLTTSLDIRLQKVAEKALGKLQGAVVAIEIETGEVLVMASKPDYDLNTLTPYIARSVYESINAKGGWINRALQGVYPPGSPFKIVTAIAALRAGVVRPDETVDCPGYYTVGNRKFPCLKRSGHGPGVTLPEAIRVSCNPLFFHYALLTGIECFSEEIERLGFGQKTGIELPFEASNTLVPKPEWKKKRHLGPWLGGDTANMAIGQGYLLVSPLQVASFCAAFARKETRIQPTILHSKQGLSQGRHAQAEPLGLSESAYNTIVEGMERAVTHGTAKHAAVAGIRIAGKTGTAQVRVKNNPIDVVWFLGYGPIEHPKIAIVVVVEEMSQEDNFWGGTTAAPIAGDVFKAYFQGQK